VQNADVGLACGATIEMQTGAKPSQSIQPTRSATFEPWECSRAEQVHAFCSLLTHCSLVSMHRAVIDFALPWGDIEYTLNRAVCQATGRQKLPQDT
jgi:hypothetical protein